MKLSRLERFTAWKKANSEKFRQYGKKLHKAKGEFLLSIKKQAECKHCKISDYRILDFAHKKPRTIGKRVNWRKLSWASINKEVKRCYILCKNCHALYDWKTRMQQDELKRSK